MAGAHGFDADSDVTAELSRKAQAGIYTRYSRTRSPAIRVATRRRICSASMASKFLAMHKPQFKLRSIRAQKSWQAQQRGILSSQLEDNIASLEATGQPVTPISDGQITAAYGDQAPRIFERLSLAKHTFNAVQQTALSSPEEDAATLATPHAIRAKASPRKSTRKRAAKGDRREMDGHPHRPRRLCSLHGSGHARPARRGGRRSQQAARLCGRTRSAAYDKLGLPCIQAAAVAEGRGKQSRQHHPQHRRQSSAVANCSACSTATAILRAA